MSRSGTPPEYRRGTVRPEGTIGGAFRGEKDQYVAYGDDGFHKQDNADPAERAPHQRQYSQSRYDVSHPVEAKPRSDVDVVPRKWQAEAACRGQRASNILGAGRGPRALLNRSWSLITEELGLTREAVYRGLAVLEREQRIARHDDGITLATFRS